jgi:hypothetical protein
LFNFHVVDTLDLQYVVVVVVVVVAAAAEVLSRN